MNDLPTLNLRELERIAIAQALEASGGSVERAAQTLGIGRATLYRRLAEPDANPTRRPGYSREGSP